MFCERNPGNILFKYDLLIVTLNKEKILDFHSYSKHMKLLKENDNKGYKYVSSDQM
jgi:hypothetical protein